MLRLGLQDNEALSNLQVAYARLERVDPESRRLPDPTTEIPDRDPDALKGDIVAQAYRRLFRDLGIDPTKRRPAGEALARRIAQGEKLPNVHPLVDAVNIASAVTLIPLHVLDADRIEPPIEITTPREGIPFDPIGSPSMTLNGEHPILRDENGPLALLAHRDGDHAKITMNTLNALVIACGPPTTGPRLLPDAFRHVERYVTLAGWRFAHQPRTIENGSG